MPSQKVKGVLWAYAQLTPSEKQEFITELTELRNKIAKGTIREGRLDSYEITLGPLQRGCPVCGR